MRIWVVLRQSNNANRIRRGASFVKNFMYVLEKIKIGSENTDFYIIYNYIFHFDPCIYITSESKYCNIHTFMFLFLSKEFRFMFTIWSKVFTITFTVWSKVFTFTFASEVFTFTVPSTGGIFCTFTFMSEELHLQSDPGVSN